MGPPFGCPTNHGDEGCALLQALTLAVDESRMTLYIVSVRGGACSLALMPYIDSGEWVRVCVPCVHHRTHAFSRLRALLGLGCEKVAGRSPMSRIDQSLTDSSSNSRAALTKQTRLERRSMRGDREGFCPS